jgi:hypothetical protein
LNGCTNKTSHADYRRKRLANRNMDERKEKRIQQEFDMQRKLEKCNAGQRWGGSSSDKPTTQFLSQRVKFEVWKNYKNNSL